MAEPTYIACPHCGEPVAMSAMQKRIYIGRTISCQQCAKPFAITEQTPDPVPVSRPRVTAPAQPTASVGVDAPQTQPASPVNQDSMTGLLQPRAAYGSIATAPRSMTANRNDGLTAGRMAMLMAIVVVVVGFLLYFALAPAIHRSREAARRASCASNLLQIGMSLQAYATANNGWFPDVIDRIVTDGSVPAELLVCPSSTDTESPGASPAEQAGNLSKGKHLSYVYLGQGKRYVGGLKQVLAYEPLEHHDGEGVNVLYTDGTVVFLTRPNALAAIPALATSGVAPLNPSSPTTLPATTKPASP